MIEIEQTKLLLSSIRTDGGTQPRAALNEEYIGDLGNALVDNIALPPVVVFFDGSEYWLADGFHRYHAMKWVGQDNIAVDVRQGTRRDAQLYSFGANGTHGLRRTNEDKRRVVKAMLNDPEWAKWSDNQIAKQCGVNQSTVSRIRQENPSYALHKIQDVPRFAERNGVTYEMKTANIGRTLPPEAAPKPEPIIHEKINSLGDIFPGIDEWQAADKPIPGSWKLPSEMRGNSSLTEEFEDEEIEEPQEITEEDRYMLAVDTGTLDYYHDDLRRDAIQRDKEKRNHVMDVMGSSESSEWYTPQEIIDTVLSCLGVIDLDPCSNSHESPTIPAQKCYTRADNGLAHIWDSKHIYMNPPYGNEISAWTQKLVQEYEAGNVEEAIALLPARIDTQWFQPLYAYPMCNIRGRLQFSNAQYSAPFPSVLIYLGQDEEKFISCFKGLGPIMRRIG